MIVDPTLRWLRKLVGQAMVAKDNFKGLAEALQYCDNQHAYGCRCVKDVAYDFATPQESFIRLSKSRSRSVLPPLKNYKNHGFAR